ncbi:type I phosphodiesterase/nucleotide pyrophosphatase family protein [Arthroderma uncinatum]|uniref:type I phosphodiesterase/nucleotide pyrophosphatase family protein n=1 Tax=Arthroderma uncinatum TaxID=74035 RepID=UPI00144AD948|nr:type I phosphodiesterase/nucleotide pyrophosphatase family protein [Arthroderma uncinatum]KAF3481879.1 type I phosphodiesterase/nucleotide pyrophosphatase family protein [Arthroderma uncinatum]
MPAVPDQSSIQRRPASSPSLLSPAGYDEDVTPLRALSDQESDSEDDQLMEASRSTLDLVQHDRTVLEEEEERERLLIKAKSSPTDGLRRIFGATPHDNGSFIFLPTTILISLDGFRADFLTRGLTPTLNSFIAGGISPKYMLPSFPSVTFPNHFTLVTGLYPESHGIVGNTFWDPELEDDFFYTKPAKSMQPKWWTAEPLWATAEKQGVKTAIHMWPGSEAHIMGIEPTFLDKYNGSEALPRKVERIFDLLDLPGEKDENIPQSIQQRRPQFIAAYVPDVDAAGHTFGPNSTEIRTTIASADKMLASILQGLDKRNLTDVVNIVVVSDHGMATTSTDRLIQLDDLVNLDLVERIDGWPLRGLVPKRAEDIPLIYEQARNNSLSLGHDQNLEIYTRETMPERYHFSHNDRIAPVWVIPKTGWAIVEKPDFDVKKAQKDGTVYHPKGLHGYDHEHPLMRAIFVARGPSFPHKANSRVEPFQNIEVYNIVCDSLRIKPHPNNGTLRLPLKPVGLHSDGKTPPIENLDGQDPPPSTTAPVPTRRPIQRPSSPTSTIAKTSTPAPPDATGKGQEKSSSFWLNILDKVRGWVNDLTDAVGLT